MSASRHFALISFNQFNPFLYDGACHCFLARLRFIQSFGNRVSIINYLSANLTHYFFSDAMADMPESVIREGSTCRAIFRGVAYYERILLFDSDATSNQAVLKTILQDLGTFKIDYAWTTDEAYLPLLVVSLLNIPCAHFFHSQDNVQRFACKPTYTLILKHRPIISNSLFLQDQIKNNLGLPSNIWRPFIDFDSYRVREFESRNYTIGFSASGGDIKGTALVAAIIARMPEISFIIVGRGLTNHLDTSLNNLSYLGHIPDMKIFYAQIDILLVPSVVEESFPRVILEAAVNGIPTIANRVGGVPEALGGSGVLIDYNSQMDIAVIAEKYVVEIRRLLNDPVLYEEHRRKALARTDAYRQTLQQESVEIYNSYFL